MSNSIVFVSRILDFTLRMFFCLSSSLFIFFALVLPLLTSRSMFFVITFISIPLSILSFISLWQIFFKGFRFFSKNGIPRFFSYVIYMFLVIYLWLAMGFLSRCVKYRYSLSRVVYSIASSVNAFNNIQLRSGENDSFSWKMRLLKNYLGLKFNESFMPSGLNNDDLRKDSLFGYDFYFINYQDLVHSFNELFIHRIYYFDSNKTNPKIIDCGSNIGLSVLYFKTLYPDANIIAFEPDELAFSALEKNVKASDFKNVKCIKAALALEEGEVKFFKKMAGSTMNSILKKWDNDKLLEIVKTLKLSSFINEEVDLIKIDVEGAERLILKDLDANNKLKFVKKIIMEFHHHIENNVDDFSRVLKILEDNNFGYQISALERPPFNDGEVQYMIVSAYKKA